MGLVRIRVILEYLIDEFRRLRDHAVAEQVQGPIEPWLQAGLQLFDLGEKHVRPGDVGRCIRGPLSLGFRRRRVPQALIGLGQGEEALRGFWRPFFVPALNASLDRVSAADAGFVLRTAFLQDRDAARLGYCTVPLARLAAAAAGSLDRVRLSAPVLGLDFPLDGRVGVLLGDGDRVAVDGIIIAVPPPQLASLLRSPERYGIPPMEGYEPRPIVDVHLWHDRGRLGFDLVALLDSPVQWVFEKAPGYLCCSMSAADEHVRKPTADLVALCWQEIGGALGALAGARLLHGSATRSPEGTYLAAPGVARPGPETTIPRLAIAGSWTATGWPDTLESSVRSGRAAAHHLLRGLGETPWTAH